MEGIENVLYAAEAAAVTDSQNSSEDLRESDGATVEQTEPGILTASPEIVPDEAGEDSGFETGSEGALLSEAEGAQGDLFIAEAISEPNPAEEQSASLKAVIEAAIYITDEPLSPEQIASAVGRSLEEVKGILKQ